MKVLITKSTVSKKRFLDARNKVDKATPAMVTKQAILLQTSVKAHASGRPGPEIETGEYNGSIRVIPVSSTNTAAVVSDHPAAARLEFGFVGEDSLGRVYDQPPFPHWRPAIQQTLPAIRNIGLQVRRLWW